MLALKKPVVFLLLFSSLLLLLGVAAALAADSPDHVVKLMYFHRRFRCPSCEVIEGGVSEMLKNSFAEQLASGAVTWQVINLDDEGNGHYPDKYDFFYNTLIVVDQKGGKEVRFKNLQKIYEFEEDVPGLKKFVKSELEAYLK